VTRARWTGALRATGGAAKCQDEPHGPRCSSQTDSRIKPRNWVNGGCCYGSVLLDNTLWQSLTAMNGRDVPWVHGCVLDHGHDGDHGAPAYPLDEEPQQWLRWPDKGPVRLEAVEPSPPARHSSPPNLSSRPTRTAVGD